MNLKCSKLKILSIKYKSIPFSLFLQKIVTHPSAISQLPIYLRSCHNRAQTLSAALQISKSYSDIPVCVAILITIIAIVRTQLIVQ